MIWVDYLIVGILAFSALVSVMRGFVREALSLAGWIAALWVASTFVDDVAVMLADQISVPSLRRTAAFLALFAGVLVATGVLVALVGLVVDRTGLSGTDRVVGMVFGLARGAVVVVLLVALAGFTALPRDPWWGRSVMIPHFQRAAEEARALLPPEVAGKMRFGNAVPGA